MKSKSKNGRPGKGAGSQKSGSYSVGYGKPPREHQFKAGTSGNPKGRPKGAKNMATIMREIFYRPIEVREGGELKKIPYIEGLMRMHADSALKRDHKSAALLLKEFAPIDAAEKRRSASEEAFAKIPMIHKGMTDKEAADAWAQTLRWDHEFPVEDEE